MTEESDRKALALAALAAVKAREAARDAGTTATPPTERKGAPPTILPPELKVLADRRARYDLGNRAVHREIFGQQGSTMARNDWDPFE
jgi:hypothetical protein